MSAFPAPGDRIGRFQVLAQLGAGGMGVVYDALEVNLGRRVALKVIAPMYADDPAFRSRFTSEARALASLDSPHVVQVYAHGEEDGHLYIATQLVPDGDLGQTITRWGPAPHGKAAELLEQVATGLADAHAAGLVHRDIKPANVLVRRRGGTTVQAYLGDFGIARRVDAEATRVGAGAPGTPSYMAPELHHGAVAGVTTDIYALGCLLWVTLTAQPPYPGASEVEIAQGHLSRPVPQLAGSTPLVDLLNRVLRVAMAKEPGHRYRTAVELRDDLREAARMTDDPAYLQLAATVTGAPTRVPPAPTPVPAAYAPPVLPPAPYAAPARRRWPWLAAAATVLVLGAGAAVAVVATSGDDEPRREEAGGATGDLTAAEQEFVDGDASAIIDTAEKEMVVLGSVRVTGTSTTDGVPGSIDLTITSRGDCSGEIGLGEGRADLRRVDGTSYVRPDRAFLEASGQTPEAADLVVSNLGDRWIADPDDQDFEAVCDIDELLEDEGDDGYTYEKGEVVDLEGATVLTVEQRGPDGDLTAYVDVKAPHYVRRLDVPADDATYTFSRFDEDFSVEAPAADDVFR